MEFKYLTFTFEYNSDYINRLENSYINYSFDMKKFFNAKEIKKEDLKLNLIVNEHFTKLYEILIKINYLDADMHLIRDTLFDNLGRIKEDCRNACIKKYHKLSGNYGGLSLNLELNKITEEEIYPLFNDFVRYLMEIKSNPIY